MTYYRDNPHGHGLKAHTPLIDLIPDKPHYLDVSDEEDSFYGNDDDFLIPVNWQHKIERLPRRLKRSVFACIVVAFIFLLSWWIYFGPRHTAYKQEIKAMDQTPEMSYGSSVRPDFKGMIQVSDMPEQHLPKKGKKLVFVGDVHGCREELEHLLKKIDFNHKHDHLVLTGDVIAKGPDSAGVVKLIQKLGASCVRGNWEDKLLLSVAEADNHALDSSGLESQSSANHELHKLAKQLTRKELEYLQQCPVILRVGSVPTLGNLVVVHAGLVPDTPLKKQDPFHVMNMRTIDLKTRIPSSKHSGTPWEKFWNHRQTKLNEHDRTTIIYGHNRKRGLNIQEYSYGLDTGCVNGQRLTALVVDAEGKTELVHVKCNMETGYDRD
ncbi:Metallo-dependent phosphatase-like protein [Phaeosphaeriaceae sp. PMI808]|nr:Metallo-dependent phosphatase-like protein [Phaeosphaeriaceae sp. PMI808]